MEKKTRSPVFNFKMTLGALGVVFGDIGTSPLYALRECFSGEHGVGLTQGNILGVVSLVLWALLLVVGVKYAIFVLRADHQGEGGIMALTARLQSGNGKSSVRGLSVIGLGLFGAALLFGDGMITPAISVLSAVEGLEVAAPALKPWIVPVTLGILLGLFAVQRQGTAAVGRWFGPVIVLWFFVIALIGLPWIVRNPGILQAINPLHAIRYFSVHGFAGVGVLSGVVLCVTGAEALYADLGHFGTRPIRQGWFAVVFPALILNYLGQGALLLEVGQAGLQNPFYSLVPVWGRVPLTLLATAATVIASQALISGTYSLTQQAIQLGYFPRTEIRHTSSDWKGQIYIPRANQFVMLGSLLLVLVFRESSALAAAYGIAVTGTMLVTSLLYFVVVRQIWKWSLPVSVGLLFLFASIDFLFLAGNMRKLLQGGWIPFVIGIGIFTLMMTWRKGRGILDETLSARSVEFNSFLSQLPRRRATRVRGSGVFLSAFQGGVPHTLIHQLNFMHVLHERVIFLTIRTEGIPSVPERERVRIEPMPGGFYRVVASYGYMERPDISEILIHCLGKGLEMNISDLCFVLGRENILPSGTSRMPYWQKKLFIYLSRNARPVSDYFGLPNDQVVEIGLQVGI